MKQLYQYRFLRGCFIFSFFLLTACVSNTDLTNTHISNHDVTRPSALGAQSVQVPVTRNSREIPDPIRGLVTLFAAKEYEHEDSIIDFDPLDPLDSLGNAISDLRFIEREGSDENPYFLKPINGAVSIQVETQSHDYSVCEQALANFNVNEISTTKEDSYICLLTNKGNLVSIKIEYLHVVGQGSIHIEYILWESKLRDLSEEFATEFPVTNTPVPPSPTPLAPTSTPSFLGNDVVTGFFRLQSQKFEFSSEQEVQPILSIDLDTNKLTYDIDGDLYYFKDCGSNCFYSLRPINQTKMLVWGDSEPTIEECQNEIDNFSTTLQFVSVDYYICALTNSEHISILHVEGMSTKGQDTWIELSFNTVN